MEHVHSRPTGIAVAGHSGALIQGPLPGQVSKLVNAGRPTSNDKFSNISPASTEITFYNAFSQWVPERAHKFFARYYGTRNKEEGDLDSSESVSKGGTFLYIVLEDLTYGYATALPLDVKMGL